MTKLTFGVITDIQYADQDDTSKRPYRNVLSKLPNAFDEITKVKPKFILNLGDTIDRDIKNFPAVLEFFPEHIPLYSVLGNHDYSAVKPEDYSKVLEYLQMPSEYYFFTADNYCFIMLDSNDITYKKSGEPAEQAAQLLENLGNSANNALRWNGAVSNTQLTWLDSTLKKAASSNQKVIICCHNAVYPDSLSNRMLNDYDVLEVLDKYPNVIAYFAGHDHDGGYAYRKGVHHVTFKAILDYYYKTAFSVVSLDNSTIIISGFGREETRELKIR